MNHSAAGVPSPAVRIDIAKALRRQRLTAGAQNSSTSVPVRLPRHAALQTTAISQTDEETRIALGKDPCTRPEPFASQLNHHLRHRPNLRTAGGAVGTPWLFTSNRPGRHIDPQAIMMRLRALGINLQGARNTALRELVSAMPAPLVAEMLGYSDQVTHKHAAEVGNTWARYVQC